MPTWCACGCGLRVQFKGCFKKGHQPAGTKRDPSGQIKAAHDKWNPVSNAKWNAINNPINNAINNPIYTAKRQKLEREAAEKSIAQMPDGEKPLTEAGAKVVAKEIMENVGNGWNTQAVAVEEFIGADDDKDYCPFYIGYTRRGLGEEALRWLTKRGAARRDADGNFTIDPQASP